MKNAFSLITILFLCFLLSFCKKENSIVVNKKDSTVLIIKKDSFFIANYQANNLVVNNSYALSPQSLATVTNDTLREASGIGESKINKDLLWVEEDSKNPNAIQLLDQNGKIKGYFTLPGISNDDWEDLSVSTGPVAGVSYVYVSETGDNKLQYPIKYVYRFPEPDITGKNFPVIEDIKNIDKIELTLPDGPKNVEALLIDPLTKDIYLISKEYAACVYIATYPQDLKKSTLMKKIAVLPLSFVTAGDISPDGNEMVIKTKTQIFYLKKSGNQSILDLIKTTPQTLPYYIEPQGEAICFNTDQSGFFTFSERASTNSQTLYFYKKK